MYLKQITPPQTEPVTLSEVKAHLRIDGSEEDELLSALITTAREMAEEYTRRAFITQTWELALDSASGKVYLPRPPVQTIDEIMLDGEMVAIENYLFLGENVFCPKIPLYAANPGGLVIRYTSGYGDSAADVPLAIRQAILMLIAHLYEHRGDDAIEIPPTVKILLRPYRVVIL